MANISDVIEQFIREMMQEEDEIRLSRNDLASHFSVVPSQINYVLATRFTPTQGYNVVSRRGGGGYIVIERLGSDAEYLKELYQALLVQPTTEMGAKNILERLHSEELISDRELQLISALITDRALNMPVDFKEKVRSNILRELIVKLM